MGDWTSPAVLAGHRERITDLAWSPTAPSLLASGSTDDSGRLWQIGGDGTVTEQATFSGMATNVDSVHWSPDGTKLALHSRFGSLAMWWDVASGAQLDRRVNVTAIAWFADSSRIALAVGSNIEVRTAEGSGDFTLTGHTSTVRRLAWSPANPAALLSVSDDRTMRLWDVNSDTAPQQFRGHSEPIDVVEWSPDGRLLLTADLATVRLWDAAAGQELYQLPGHFQTSAINWVNNDQLLTLGGLDQLVRVWDVAAQQPLALLGNYGTTGEIRTLAWSPDNTRLAVLGSDDVVRIWDASSGAVVQALVGHTIRGPRIGGGNGYQPVNAVIWSPDGRFLATGGSDETIRVWDAATGQQQFVLTETAPVRALAWSHDGNFLAATTSDEWDEAGHVRVWNLDSSSEVWRRSHPMIRVSDVAFSLDDTKLAVGGWSGNGGVMVLDATTGSILRFFQLNNEMLDVARLLWKPDNRSIITAARHAGDVHFWNAIVFDSASPALDSPVEGVDPRSLADMAIFPDGITLLTLGSSGNLRVWQSDPDNRIIDADPPLPEAVANGHVVGSRSTFVGRHGYLALSPTGQRLAVVAADGQTVQIFMIRP